jgi:hypothetical protein
MVIFVTALQHLLALDLFWFVQLIMENLAISFMLLATIWIFTSGKHFFYGTIVFAFLAWWWTDFQPLAGMVIFVGGFMLLNYLKVLTHIAVSEGNNFLTKNYIWMAECLFIVLVIAWLVWGGG